MTSDDNIVKLPSLLERQAKRIQHSLEREVGNRASWVEIMLERADALAIAKQEIPDTQEFGRWCSSNGFGENIISRDTRAALIKFGENLERARIVLEKTERRSIEHIYKNEWIERVRHMPKSEKVGGVKFNAAKAYVEAHEESTGKLPKEQDIMDATGVGVSVAFHALRVTKNVQAAEAKVGLSDERPTTAARVKFTKAQERHVEIRLRQAKKQQDAEFNERVRLAMLERNKAYLADLNALEAEARRKDELYGQLINEHKPIFTEEEYRTILICLHPDNSATPERRSTAFKAFTAVKLQLTGKA